jgi:ABC-type glutathione transport system ATPase component
MYNAFGRIFREKVQRSCDCAYDSTMAALLEVRGLTVDLPTTAGWVRPVNEVSLCVGAGESLGLVGESGSGKPVLSLALMELLPPGARVSSEVCLSTDAFLVFLLRTF